MLSLIWNICRNSCKHECSFINRSHVPRCLYTSISSKLYFSNQDNSTYTFEHDKYLEVSIPRWPKSLYLSYVWLRDNCQCDSCCSKTTFQHILDIYDIPLNIKPISIENNGKELQIIWPDNHKTNYDFKFIWENIYEGLNFKQNQLYYETWDKFNFPGVENITVSRNDFKNDSEKATKSLIKFILKYGVGFISDVDVNETATKEAVEIICPPLKTFFGDFWTFRNDGTFNDSAYSSQFLGLHTDNTYLTEAARIQVFHCLESATEGGGETSLSDGFNVGQKLLKSNRKCFDFFTSVPLPSVYVGDGQFHRCTDVVLKLAPNAYVEQPTKFLQFRYNLYDRSPPTTIPFDQMDDYYEHLRTLSSEVRNPTNCVSIKLEPGQVLFIDNWRVMHGRNSFKGSRTMTGCYLGNSDFNSRARTLGFHVD